MPLSPAITSERAGLFVDCRQELAEGPVWHEGALWWVDILAGRLCRYDPTTGTAIESRTVGRTIGVALPAPVGWWWVARESDCVWLHWASGQMVPAATPNPPLAASHRFNDGRCDPTGRPWVGSMDRNDSSGNCALFRQDESGVLQAVLPGVSLSNGLAWSPAGTRFYYVDTPTCRVDVFDFSDGRISNRQPLVQFTPADGFPDGLTCDAEGHLWVALWGGAKVLRIDGRTGERLAEITLPVSQVSSCTFGGPENRTLFITTAREHLDETALRREPHAGSIFRLETQIHGQSPVLCTLPPPPRAC